jgi:hypothetical protein
MLIYNILYYEKKNENKIKIFHFNCFKCIECNKKLNLSNYFENNDEIYCKFCVNGKQSVMI